METKEYIDELDRTIEMLDKSLERLEEIKKSLSDVIVGLADDGNLKQCQACEEYVPEDHIVDFYGEDICLDCRGNGYGK